MVEVLNISEKIFVPILLAYMVFLFDKRGKKADVDIGKVKELNLVLSDMLKCWNYLIRLETIMAIYEEKSEDLIIPKKFFPYITLHSGVLNDSCFQDLDASIEMLKKYDALSYFELEGIGKRYQHFKSTYTVPFLQSDNPTEVGLNMNRHFMDRLLNEIEEHLRETSKRISKAVYKRIEEKLTLVLERGGKEYIEEFNNEFYDFVTQLMPEEMERPSYPEFVKEFRNPEIQEQFLEQFTIMAKAGMDKVTAIIMKDPSLSLEEVEEMIREGQPI